MSDQSERIVKKLWSYCQVLRDDGLSYQDYLEQLTFLLFLKMADERAALTGEAQPIPKGYRWENLANPKMEGVQLEQHYRDTLKALGEQGGMLGLTFRKAQNKIQDPAKLRKLVVDLIGNEQWLAMSADVKGDAYEGLLERNAQDVKGGAGQYFTPRPLIDAIVDCIQPKPGAKAPWTKKVWFYDLRTNKDFTLKTRRMTRADLDEFVACYNPANRNQRKVTWDEKKHPDGRWRAFTYDEIAARDKCSLDLFWLKDDSLEDSANLPEPHVLAEEIADDLRSALEQIESVLADLQQRALSSGTRD